MATCSPIWTTLAVRFPADESAIERGAEHPPRSGSWRLRSLAEGELTLVEGEMPGRIAVDVGKGHVRLEERVPARRVVHPARQVRRAISPNTAGLSEDS